MKTNIIQIGNSQGIRIPKAILEQLQFKKEVELEVIEDGLLLRPLIQPRANWTEMFAKALKNQDSDADEFTDWERTTLSSFDEDEW